MSTVVEELIASLGWDLTGEEDLRKFKKGMSDAEKGLAAFAARAGAFAAAAGAAFATGMGLLGRSVIATSAEFEGYQATLESVEGSADKARASLDWVAEFAKTTPYDVAQVTESFIRMRAYGLDPMDGSLRAVGDAASAMGRTIMDGVEAIADATTGENERLKAFGITTEVAGKKITYTWRENGKEFKRTLDKNGVEIAKFLRDNFERRFGGAMDNQSRTWNGMVANLGDTWTDFQRRIGRAGFFDTVKAQLDRLMSFIGQLDADGSLDRWAENLSWAFTTASNIIGSLAVTIGRDIATIGKLIMENREAWEWLKWVLVAIGVRLFPLTAIFAAAAIAIDDFLTYMRGGESVIGDFIHALAEFLGADPQAVADALGAIAKSAGMVAAAAVGVGLFAGQVRLLASALGLLGGAKAAGGIGILGKLGAVAAAVFGTGEVIKAGEDAILKDPEMNKRTEDGKKQIHRWRQALGTANDNSSHPYLNYSGDGSVSARPGETVPDLQQLLRNLEGNTARMGASQAGAAVENTVNDSRQTNITTSIVQNIQQASQAPAAAASATAAAVNGAARSGGLPPTRISGSGAF